MQQLQIMSNLDSEYAAKDRRTSQKMLTTRDKPMNNQESKIKQISHVIIMSLSMFTLAWVTLIGAGVTFRSLNDLLFDLAHGCLGCDSEARVPFETPNMVSSSFPSLLFLTPVTVAFFVLDCFTLLVLLKILCGFAFFSSLTPSP